eukprot:TRINITY_DN40691_c0_g1_i1.p1 TRINITY_DN40691_c0_g1~~TRINITY_DN40691_c0_g1_i1.p1  ORF type:complete len:625 (+),score=139.84 TRINITY_DN40691_c0_g1_i1:72-1946(+)
MLLATGILPRHGASFVLILLAVAQFPGLDFQTACAAASLIQMDELPLQTAGRFVVGQSGKRVKLACVNWYGASQQQMVINGFDNQPIHAIPARTVELGFNCIRLPFNLDMLLTNATVPAPEESLAANPQLWGLTPLQVFDATVTELTKAGLLVILNNHVSAAGWCCSGNDGEGLWYTDRYSEEDWLRGISFMARRYKDNALVAGFDIRNEVRANGLVLPTWGSGDRLTDWSMAAVKGAKKVLAENPRLLIVVSGIHFGMRLSEVPHRPIHEEVPELHNRTMYTTHFYYGWSFDLMAYDMIGRNIPTLMAFACWLWLLLLLDGWMSRSTSWRVAHEEQEEEAHMPADSGNVLQEAWKHFKLWASGRCEMVLSVAVLLLQAFLFSVGEHLGQTCGHIHIVSPPAFVVLSSVCFHVSYFIWARILLAYTFVILSGTGGAADDSRYSLNRDLSIDNPNEEEMEASFDFPAEGASKGGKDAMKRVASTAVSICSRRACSRLVEPLRARKSVTGLAALAFLSLVGVIGQRCGSYANFQGELDACLGPLLSGHGVTPAPVWLSEFGTDVRDNYWIFITRYLKENHLDFAYWSINGEKRTNESETYGLLGDDNMELRDPWKLQNLQSVIAEN